MSSMKPARMQFCIAFPLHVVFGVLMAACCSALTLENFAGIIPSEKSSRALVASSDVEYAKGLINCPKGKLVDDLGICEEMSLLLDIYTPDGTLNVTGDTLRPALLLVHGGANSLGDKGQQQSHAHFFAKHGYVVFVPDYRLGGDHGNYPGEDFDDYLSPWSTLYPAVRDVKAAFRYIVANADAFGVNESRIAAMGVSAGAMDVLAAFGTNNNSQFTTEFSWAEDPTLSTVHADLNATAQAIIMKSGNAWGVESYSKYSGDPAPWQENNTVNVRPLLQFHGTADTIIPFEHAHTAAMYWNQTGAQGCLHVLDGVGHLSLEATDSSNKHTYDMMALHYLASLDASPTHGCCPGADPLEC